MVTGAADAVEAPMLEEGAHDITTPAALTAPGICC
jgi:hypothetical protein